MSVFCEFSTVTFRPKRKRVCNRICRFARMYIGIQRTIFIVAEKYKNEKLFILKYNFGYYMIEKMRKRGGAK